MKVLKVSNCLYDCKYCKREAKININKMIETVREYYCIYYKYVYPYKLIKAYKVNISLYDSAGLRTENVDDMEIPEWCPLENYEEKK